LSKKAKRWLKLLELDYWKSEENITHFCFSIKVSRPEKNDHWLGSLSQQGFFIHEIKIKS
jgi:hypothetical protein